MDKHCQRRHRIKQKSGEFLKAWCVLVGIVSHFTSFDRTMGLWHWNLSMCDQIVDNLIFHGHQPKLTRYTPGYKAPCDVHSRRVISFESCPIRKSPKAITSPSSTADPPEARDILRASCVEFPRPQAVEDNISCHVNFPRGQACAISSNSICTINSVRCRQRMCS